MLLEPPRAIRAVGAAAAIPPVAPAPLLLPLGIRPERGASSHEGPRAFAFRQAVDGGGASDIGSAPVVLFSVRGRRYGRPETKASHQRDRCQIPGKNLLSHVPSPGLARSP